LIAALLKSGRLAEATKLCEESIAALPDSAELHFYRSDLYLHAGEKALAIESCRRALALNPVLLAAQQSLSRLLLDTEQLEQAEASYRGRLNLPLSILVLTISWVWCSIGMARHVGAIEQFKRAISLKSPLGRVVL